MSRNDSAAILELKAFESSALQEALDASSGYVVRDASVELNPTRNKLLEAHKQLKPYGSRPEPLIVAIANPDHHWVPTENARDTMAAMYGDQAIRVTITTGDCPPPDDQGRTFFDRNGVYGGGLHAYIAP